MLSEQDIEGCGIPTKFELRSALMVGLTTDKPFGLPLIQIKNGLIHSFPVLYAQTISIIESGRFAYKHIYL